MGPARRLTKSGVNCPKTNRAEWGIQFSTRTAALQSDSSAPPSAQGRIPTPTGRSGT